ncbi:MAG: hypothetical protein SVO01_01185 [Thermotogota bacterium]|nr:hypothetical protein [Thermotogota bacterium]
MSTTASYNVWSTWTSDTSSTACSCNDYIWSTWVDGTSSSTCIDSSEVWTTWTGGYVICVDSAWDSWNSPSEHTYVHDYASVREESQEERQRRVERERIQREENRTRYEKLLEEKKKAEEKAKQLLLDLIGEDQLKVYEETGRVLVKGRQYDYIIQKHGFIKRIEKDKIQDICVHLENKNKYPDTDNVIAMMLSLKADENGVNKLANLHGSYEKTDEVMESLRAAVGM